MDEFGIEAGLGLALGDIIEVDLDPYDISPALVRLGRRLGKRVEDA